MPEENLNNENKKVKIALIDKIALGVMIIVALFVFLVIFSMILSLFDDGKYSKTISKSEYGNKWAFTVDHLDLHADKENTGSYNSVAVYAYDDKGNLYPLNGIAKSKFQGKPNVKDVSTIQLDDEEFNKMFKGMSEGEPFTPVKKDISFAIDEGMKMAGED